MKKNQRVRPEGNAARVTKQSRSNGLAAGKATGQQGGNQSGRSPVAPLAWGQEGGYQLLVNGSDVCEDGLWAGRDGRLFLWRQPEKFSVPREVDFAQAREWWMKFHRADPGLASPQFPEGSAAERFVGVVCGARQARRAGDSAPATGSRAPQLKALPAESPKVAGGDLSPFRDLDEVCQTACGLMSECARRITTQPHCDLDHLNNADCGCLNLADQCSKALDADVNAVFQERWDEGQVRESSIARLRFTINKAAALVWLLANGLAGFNDARQFYLALQEETQPAADTSGYLLLAEEVAAALEKVDLEAISKWRAVKPEAPRAA